MKIYFQTTTENYGNLSFYNALQILKNKIQNTEYDSNQ